MGCLEPNYDHPVFVFERRSCSKSLAKPPIDATVCCAEHLVYYMSETKYMESCTAPGREQRALDFAHRPYLCSSTTASSSLLYCRTGITKHPTSYPSPASFREAKRRLPASFKTERMHRQPQLDETSRRVAFVRQQRGTFR